MKWKMGLPQLSANEFLWAVCFTLRGEEDTFCPCFGTWFGLGEEVTFCWVVVTFCCDDTDEEVDGPKNGY